MVLVSNFKCLGQKLFLQNYLYLETFDGVKI